MLNTRRYSDTQKVDKSIEPSILQANAKETFIQSENNDKEKKLLRGLSEKLIESEGRAVIAGGAILSIVNKEYVKDYDLYVNKSYAKDIIEYLLSDGELITLVSIYNTPAYDQSFFRKNKIIGRLLFQIKFDDDSIDDSIDIDLLIVRDDTKLIDVVSNFDLTFCEVWYNGIDFYANYPDDVRNKVGSLKQDYVESLVCGNTFILRRMRKYRRRGYIIEISCKKMEKNFLFQDLKLKKNEIIEGTAEERKEEWAVSFIMKNILKFLKFQYVKENIVDFILDQNTKANLTSLFANLKLKNDNRLVSIENLDRFVGPFSNTSLYTYLCYIFYMNLSFCISEDDVDYEGESPIWFNYLQKFVKTNLISDFKYGELLRDLVDENDRISYRLFGKKYSNDIHNDGLYSIYMSSEFVKYTQFKQFIQLDDDTRDNIRAIEASGNGDVHLIYACPDGHLHASNNCGVPTTISKCNYPTNPTTDGVSCQNYVGGLYHMLVPGNYIVKHDGYPSATLHYGYFPVYAYKTYEKMYEQAQNAIKKYNSAPPSSPSQFIIADLSLKSENRDGNITAKKYTTAEEPGLRPDNNVTCFVCAEEFSKTDDGKYDATVEGNNELYILPCNHLIHKGCLATARGLNEDDFDPNNINVEVDVSGRICPHTTCNQKRFLFGSKRSLRANQMVSKRSLRANQMVRKRSADRRSAANQTVRKRSYVKLAGSIRMNRIRTNKRSKKRSINKYRFGSWFKSSSVNPSTGAGKKEAPQLSVKPKAPQLSVKPKAPQLSVKPKAPQLSVKPKAPQLSVKPKAPKKFPKGYITWHKWQEELKENGKREELLVLNNNKKVIQRKIVPLASEIKRRKSYGENVVK